MRQVSKSPILSKSSSKKKYFQPEGERKLSPSPSQQAKMYKLNRIPSYLRMDRPKLTVAKQDFLKRKIETDVEVRITSTQRIKDGKLFVGYKFNPFTSFSQSNLHKPKVTRNISQPRIQSYHEAFTREDEPYETIIDALNNGERKLETDNKFRINQEAKRRLSLKISQSIPTLQQQPLKKTEKLSISIDKEAELALDKIINMKDENYFIENSRNSKKCNIFRYRRRSFSSVMDNDILKKHNFSYFALIDRNQKYKSYISRDLSKHSRQFAAGRFTESQNKRLQSIKPSQMTVDLSKINSENLISIASGRLTTEKVYEIMNEKSAKKNTIISQQSELSSEDLTYNQNTNHNMMNFDIPNEEIVQIQDYNQLPLHRNEREFAKKCAYFHQNMVSHLQSRANLIKDSIKDSKQHKKYKEMALKESESFLNFHNQLKSTHTSKEKLIEMNKLSKDRKESILLRQLIKSIVTKNKTQANFEQLMPKQAKKKKRMI